MKELQLVVAIGILLISWVVPARAGVIDFEDLAVDTAVLDQYAARGVTFPQSPRIVEPAGGTQSPTRALSKHHPGQEFDSPPLVIEFDVPQNAVSLYAGLDWSSTVDWDAELVAYDESSNVVAQVAVTLPAGSTAVSTPFSVFTIGRIIHSVELLYVGSAFEVIDDLTFSHELGGPDGGDPDGGSEDGGSGSGDILSGDPVLTDGAPAGDPPAGDGASSGCTIAADCGVDGVCESGRCVATCETNADCLGGEECAASRCRSVCATSVVWLGGQVCTGNLCLPATTGGGGYTPAPEEGCGCMGHGAPSFLLLLPWLVRRRRS